MSDDVAPSRKIFQFPHEQVTEEERNRRIMVEVGQLAAQPGNAWKLWYRDKAELLGIEPDQFAELIEAQIAAREKAAAEKLEQDKLGRFEVHG